ncbi:MAG: glycosyltransferase [Eubacteriales bacterium]|nr:glycosyltransferase [Eubacteriales bacterium]
MRVLILSCNTGEGHNSCAGAIREVMETRGHSCDIEDSLRFISPRVSRFIGWGHTTLYRHMPWLFSFGYSYAEKHPMVLHHDSAIYKLIASGEERLYEFIKEGHYDVVVNVHVFPALMLTELMKRHPLDIKTAFVATDYTCSPGVKQSKTNYCFIPHTSIENDFLCEDNTDTRIIPGGIPVRQAFFHSVNKRNAKREVGVSEDLPHLLIMCGSMGCGPIKELVKLLSTDEGFEMTVVCGTNRKLYEELKNKYGGFHHIHIRGFEKNMPLLMDSADLYLTKPGGLSTTEAYAKALPMVFVDAVAGCEEYNLNFFINSGAAVTGHDVYELRALCMDLLKNPTMLSVMREAMQKSHVNNGAEVICETLEHSQNAGIERISLPVPPAA